MFDVSILMPCLNEEKTLKICVQKAKKWLQKSKIKGEIIVSDNGSEDNSLNICREEGVRIVNTNTKGYGSALINGINHSKSDIVIMADSDNSYDFEELDEFYYNLKKNNFDLVVGNRFLGKIEKGSMPWKNRYIGNPVLSFIAKIFFSTPIKDFHCGLRGINKKSFDNYKFASTGMEFATEMIAVASLKKLKMLQVPINFFKDGRDRDPHLNPWRDGWRHLRYIFSMSPKKLLIFPGMISFIFGSILFTNLYFNKINIGGFILDLHSFLLIGLILIIGQLSFLTGAAIHNFNYKKRLVENDIFISFTHKYEFSNKLFFLGILILIFSFILGIFYVLGWSKLDFQITTYAKYIKEVILFAILVLFSLTNIIFSFLFSYIFESKINE